MDRCFEGRAAVIIPWDAKLRVRSNECLEVRPRPRTKVLALDCTSGPCIGGDEEGDNFCL